MKEFIVSKLKEIFIQASLPKNSDLVSRTASAAASPDRSIGSTSAIETSAAIVTLVRRQMPSYFQPSSSQMDKHPMLTWVVELKTCVSWPATTQLTAQGFGVKLVSKTVQKAGFAGFTGL